MSTLTKRNDKLSLNDWFRDFFDVDPFFNRLTFGSLPAANISEADDKYEIEMAIPGFNKEDFKVKVEKDMLTVSAESKSEKQEEDKTYTRKEFNYSSFSRSFRLPDNVQDDAITAKYDNGILKLQLPKTEKSITASKEIKVS